MQKNFAACLMTDAKIALGVEAWRHLPDPFPSWSNVHEELEETA